MKRTSFFLLFLSFGAMAQKADPCAADKEKLCSKFSTVKEIDDCLIKNRGFALGLKCEKFLEEKQAKFKKDYGSFFSLCREQFEKKCEKNPKGRIDLGSCFATATFEGPCAEKLRELKKIP